VQREVRQGKRLRVALVVVATGAYVQHVRLFARSASRLFMIDHEVCNAPCLLLPFYRLLPILAQESGWHPVPLAYNIAD